MVSKDILIHCENINEITPFIPDTTKLSKWVSGSWGKARYVLNKRIDKGYVVLPMYLNDKGIQDEWQSQISGKAKKTENIFEAAQREIFEEIGLAFRLETIMRCYVDNEEFRGCNVHYFIINLDMTEDIISPTYEDIFCKCKERSSLPDDKYTRISVFIHFNEINENTLNIIFNRKRIECSDDAGKVILLMHKKHLFNIMKNFQLKKPKETNTGIIWNKTKEKINNSDKFHKYILDIDNV